MPARSAWQKPPWKPSMGLIFMDPMEMDLAAFWFHKGRSCVYGGPWWACCQGNPPAKKPIAPAYRWWAIRHGPWRTRTWWIEPCGGSGGNLEAITATNAFSETAIKPSWKMRADCTTSLKSFPSSKELSRNGPCSSPSNWSQPAVNSVGMTRKPGTPS